jgi:hypothetical protein
MGLATPKAVIIGLVTEVGEEQVSASGAAPGFRKIARLDLIGELSGAGRFQRGVTEYPNIGDAASLLTERELRLVSGPPTPTTPMSATFSRARTSACTSTSIIW